MFREIGEFDSLIVEDEQLEMVLRSVSEGNTEGRLWECEGTYFLWDKGNIVLYVFGEDVSQGCSDGFIEFFQVVREDASEEGFSHFKFNDLTGTLETSLFLGVEFRSLEKYFYRFVQGEVEEFRSSVDLDVVDIDGDFFQRTGLRNLPSVIEEVKWMWPSFSKYYEKGFGKAGVVGNDIACWCTAEYVSEGRCGIGIETVQEYQQKGIATRVAAEFVEECLKRDIVPYWECGALNEPSVKLAEKLGFEKVSEFEVLLGKF